MDEEVSCPGQKESTVSSNDDLTRFEEMSCQQVVDLCIKNPPLFNEFIRDGLNKVSNFLHTFGQNVFFKTLEYH